MTTFLGCLGVIQVHTKNSHEVILSGLQRKKEEKKKTCGSFVLDQETCFQFLCALTKIGLGDLS